jgi:hypothetical protein
MSISNTRSDSKISILLLSLLLAVPALANPVKHHQRPKKAEKQQEATSQPAPAPTPETLAQLPAVPAQVTYRNNLLTINAQNSTIADILHSVQLETGAVMDFPPNAAERVVGHFGPGPARDVLAALFDGSNFNYVLLGSASDPSGIERVIVTVRPSGPDFTPAPSQPQPPYAGYQAPQPRFPQANDPDNDSDEDQSPPEAMTPDQMPDNSQVQDNDSSSDDQQGQNPSGVRTPEQLLQELERQQQLQQQQQQNGTQPPHRPQ